MKIDFTKTSHIIFFAALLPGLSLAAAYGLSLLWQNPPFWVETLSPLAIYGLLFTAFDRYAWRWPVFRWLGVVTLHNLSGRWYGTQLSSFKKQDGTPTKSRIILEVEQTFSGVSATTYYKRWRSAHCNCAFMQIDDQTNLVLIFEGEPNVHNTGESQRHKGLTQLAYYPAEGKIRGTYFNTNGNSGEITLQRSTKPIQHQFEAED